MTNFEEFYVKTAWAVPPIRRNPKNEKRCWARILAEGQVVSWHENVPTRETVVVTAQEYSISCKSILKNGKLHKGMLQNSYLWDELRYRIAYDRDDGKQITKLIEVPLSEDWNETLDRIFCHCPFATNSWDCNRCGPKTRDERKTREAWLSSCAIARKHDEAEQEASENCDEMSQDEWEAVTDP